MQALHINTPAAAFIAQQVRAHPGEVTVLALGPLTNIAMALQTDEGLHEDIVSSRAVFFGDCRHYPHAPRCMQSSFSPCRHQPQSVACWQLCVGLHLYRLQASSQLHAHPLLPASHALGILQAGWRL